MKNAEFYRYRNASAADVSKLTINAFAQRWVSFVKFYQDEEKFRIALAKLSGHIK